MEYSARIAHRVLCLGPLGSSKVQLYFWLTAGSHEFDSDKHIQIPSFRILQGALLDAGSNL